MAGWQGWGRDAHQEASPLSRLALPAGLADLSPQWLLTPGLSPHGNHFLSLKGRKRQGVCWEAEATPGSSGESSPSILVSGAVCFPKFLCLPSLHHPQHLVMGTEPPALLGLLPLQVTLETKRPVVGSPAGPPRGGGKLEEVFKLEHVNIKSLSCFKEPKAWSVCEDHRGSRAGKHPPQRSLTQHPRAFQPREGRPPGGAGATAGPGPGRLPVPCSARRPETPTLCLEIHRAGPQPPLSPFSSSREIPKQTIYS